jgi:hypothetical protein
MKTWWVLLACTLALLGVLVAVLCLPESPNAHGGPHPGLAPMHQGGEGWQRHGRLLAVGWTYGVLQIGLFVTALRLGLRRGKGRAVLALGGIAYGAAFTLVMAAYAGEISSGTTHLVLGFPLSTAVMLFVLWPLPGIFIAAYVLKFDSWVLSPEDRRKFAELCARPGRDREGAGDGP